MADDIVYIDVEEGSKRVMNNIKLYVKLLGKFKEDQSMGQLNTALADGNMDTAYNAAHTVKGLAANLSLHELYKKCVELESQIKAGSVNPDQSAVFMNVYEQTLLEVDKVISQYA
jgi:HPt (histidine-containing phosphotransfer) domain-containing protein